jgi:stage V sporulation protein SpoVS
MEIPQIVIVAVKGTVAGAIAAAIGYLKRPEGEAFSATKASKTVLVGMITGGVVAATGYDVETVEAYLAFPLIVYGIDAATKLIARKVQAFYDWLKR